MIRKLSLRLFAAILIILMAANAYLAIHRVQLIQSSADRTLQNSSIQANIAAVLQDLTDMETGQRGYLLTEDSSYLLPYTQAKNKIASDFTSLRAGLANRSADERATESQLETLAASKQTEMEHTITLRQQGYRHRAFVMVNTNEGRDYMDQARKLASSLSSEEGASFAKFDKERTERQNNALSETVIASCCVLILTVFLFALARYHERVLEQEVVKNARVLALRETQLEKLTSALSNDARSKIEALGADASLLLENYGGFLPRHGQETAEHMKETAAQLEQLRQELLGRPELEIDRQAA